MVAEGTVQFAVTADGSNLATPFTYVGAGTVQLAGTPLEEMVRLWIKLVGAGWFHVAVTAAGVSLTVARRVGAGTVQVALTAAGDSVTANEAGTNIGGLRRD